MERERIDYAAGRAETLGGSALSEAGYLLQAHAQYLQLRFHESHFKK